MFVANEKKAMDTLRYDFTQKKLLIWVYLSEQILQIRNLSCSLKGQL